MKIPERPLHEYLAQVSEHTAVRRGVPLPMGTHQSEGGVNFAFFSRNASRVRLELYDRAADATPSSAIDLDPSRNRTGDVWHVCIAGIRPGQLYGYRVAAAHPELEAARGTGDQVEPTRTKRNATLTVRTNPSLARKAKAVGRKALMGLDTLVCPDTLLRWHRHLVAQKWSYAHRRSPGRPGIMRQISELICRMALENPSWGYTRIQGALGNLGHNVARGTVANVLKRSGIEPAPERGKRTSWSTFLRAHWKVLAASDFFTVEVWTPRGLLTHYVLLVMSVAERVVHIAGITTRPDEVWMLRRGRSLVDDESGALASKRYLIVDRDTKYTQQFRRLVEDSGTEVIRLPPMSPNLNAHAERFVRSIKHECLNRMIFIGQASLRRAVSEFMEHYHKERNHQGLDNELIRKSAIGQRSHGCVKRRSRLGGTLNHYYRCAA